MLHTRASIDGSPPVQTLAANTFRVFDESAVNEYIIMPITLYVPVDIPHPYDLCVGYKTVRPLQRFLPKKCTFARLQDDAGEYNIILWYRLRFVCTSKTFRIREENSNVILFHFLILLFRLTDRRSRSSPIL